MSMTPEAYAERLERKIAHVAVSQPTDDERHGRTIEGVDGG